MAWLRGRIVGTWGARDIDRRRSKRVEMRQEAGPRTLPCYGAWLLQLRNRSGIPLGGLVQATGNRWEANRSQVLRPTPGGTATDSMRVFQRWIDRIPNDTFAGSVASEVN